MVTLIAPEECQPAMSLYFASVTAKQVQHKASEILSSSARRQPLRHELRKSELATDNSEVMSAYMKCCVPSLPRTNGCEKNESPGRKRSKEGIYVKRLRQVLEDSQARRDDINVRTPSLLDNSSTVIDDPTQTSWARRSKRVSRVECGDKDALQAWREEEERRFGRLDGNSRSSCTAYTFSSTMDAGRFPVDASMTIAKVVSNMEKEQRFTPTGRRSRTAASFSDTLAPAARRPSHTVRLKVFSMGDWSERQSTSTQSDVRTPEKSKSDQKLLQESLSLKWRREFDHVNSKEQQNVAESLVMRDVCRKMVIRHEALSSGRPPMVALADMFQRAPSPAFHARAQKRTEGEELVWGTMWTRRANEIALEQERQRLISDVENFRSCVKAASLSRAAVDDLQTDFVRVLRSWPSHYQKRHIFTVGNFIELIRSRYSLSASASSTNATTLTESMPSSAEAEFVEYVLNILPKDNSPRPATR
ncbi:hypothetical protein TRVL_02048 [Trypanosoma vivax]|nr:hypothetical protein TRVL_02048 [Trypanosoma vivax]